MLFLWSSVLLCGVLVSFDFVPFCSWCFFFFLLLLVLFSLFLLLWRFLVGFLVFFCVFRLCFLEFFLLWVRVVEDNRKTQNARKPTKNLHKGKTEKTTPKIEEKAPRTETNKIEKNQNP